MIKLVERQLRASHAIGKLIVDGVLGRAASVFSPTAAGDNTTTGTPTTAEHSTSTEPALPVPSADFALLTSAEVVDLISRSSDVEVAAIGAYERQHRRRRLVLEAVAARGVA